MTDDDVIRMIRDLPDLEPPPGWQERLRERLEREWSKEHGRLREIDKSDVDSCCANQEAPLE